MGFVRALVVFTDDGAHPMARFLKCGFRHCFMAVNDGAFWTVIDAVAGVPFVKVAAASDYDLRAFYECDGKTVLEVSQGTVASLSPFVVANCVGLVKAMLAIRAPLVWSPWQLYRHLEKRNALASREEPVRAQDA